MRRNALILSFLIFASIASTANEGLLKCTENEAGQVNNKTKLLKTYTREYWKIATAEIKSLPQPLLKSGFVTGDFHFNNAGIYFDFERNRADFQIIDFDDAGKNYLIIDFFKFFTYLQKLDKSIETKQLFSAYIDGLYEKEAAPPSEIESIIYRSQLEFSKDSRKYIEKQREEITAFDKSDLKKDVLQKIERLKKLKVISRLRDLDYMIQINDSGSSMDALRVQFIGTDENGVTGVVEFKQMKCAATGNPDIQNVSENFNLIKKNILAFNPGSIVKNQFVYRLDDENFFIVREKKKNFLKKIDLESLPSNRLASVASYYANYLGRLHAPSADRRYKENVQSQTDELIEKAKSISKKFKDEVKN